METKKKKAQKIDEEAEARINNAYADFMERAMENDAKNPYRDQSKRLIDAQKKKKANKK